MNQLFRRKNLEVAPHTQPRSSNDHERVAALVTGARKKIVPFAQSKGLINMQTKWPGMFKLGSNDGVGFIIKLASFDLDGDSRISAAELSRFQLESEKLIEGLQAALLNYSVLLSLLLTVYVSLFVLQLGSSYRVDGPFMDEWLSGDAALERGIYADLASSAPRAPTVGLLCVTAALRH